ncbi:MAG TPA: ABC transporter permease subunit [Parachlamydiaceae bacterium]|nr:ABC transporter permease subunit [Parachlamydiaceae bacterium]
MHQTYMQTVFANFKKQKIAYISLFVILLFCLVGIYAPFLASSKPLFVKDGDTFYFPLFRYLFFQGFYTKPLDLFFNLLMFTFPLMAAVFFIFKNKKKWLAASFLFLLFLQFALFLFFLLFKVKDPAEDIKLNQARQEALIGQKGMPSFAFDLKYMNDYKKLNLVLRHVLLKRQNQRLNKITAGYREDAKKHFLENEARDKRLSLLRQGIAPENIPNEQELKKMVLSEMKEEDILAKTEIPTLFNNAQENEKKQIARLKEALAKNPEDLSAKDTLQYIQDKNKWLKEKSGQIKWLLMPLIRDFHFEEDAGGEQGLNQHLPWWELSRVNRKDLTAALIFGVRVSLVVGLLAVGLSLLIGIPIGAYAGYYGGNFDIIVSRLIEVLDAMPTFFMLLMIIAIMQSKSIFLVIVMIGFFGWTGFSRYIRAEFFKQRNLPYVESAHALGYKNSRIMFSHILPNAIPPLLTLLPFAVMGAITSEAGLSFLGLGEEGAASWGVLMDEGRSAFPQESYLLWPPAILLTLLLVAIALVGDGLRDAIDPKMR